jgi:isopenicillin-N N-acyltransferase-like protein
MSDTNEYPHVRVSGDPRTRGRSYGEQAAARVRRSVELYRDVFEHYAGWDWQQVTTHALRFGDPIRAAHASYLDEMEGIAEGAGVEPADILAINVRTEVMFSAVARQAAVECTSLAALPEATVDGHVLIGQNWDWKPHTVDTVIVLEVERDDGPDFITIVEAGLLAKTGMNEAGIGLVTNALISDADHGDPALPYHIILRAILDAENLPDALDAVTRHPRSSAANYLIAHRDGMAVDIEAAPGDYSRVWLEFPVDGLVCHANHYICNTQDLKDVTRWYAPDSPFRFERAKRMLEAERGCISPESIGRVFGDHTSHPLGICKHGNSEQHEYERTVTVVSVVYDLTACEVRIADGYPCEREFRTLDYAHWATAAATGSGA